MRSVITEVKALQYGESDDLVNWTEQRLAKIGDEQFGCLWAPDVIYDKRQKIMLCTGLLLMQEIITVKKQFL